MAHIFVLSGYSAPEMLAVTFYGLEVVYGFRERRLCCSIFFGTVFLETQRSSSFFVFGHWGMFTALAYGTSGLVLNAQRGAMDGVRYKGCSKPAM